MKICILFPKDSVGFFLKGSNVTFGGATVQLHRIATEISRSGHDLLCLLPGYNGFKSRFNSEYKVLEPYQKNDFLLVKFIKLIIVLARTRPEVVIQRGLVLLTILFAVFCKVMGLKFIFMFAHDVETLGYYQNSRKKALFYRILISCSYRLICQSEAQYRNIPYKYREKTRVIKKGIDPVRTRPGKADYSAIWIGRCERWKNPQEFISLASRNPRHRFCMICSATDKESSFFKHIKLAALQYDNIDFREHIPNEDVFAYLRRSKVFCITSDMEGDWPMTVLEAASYGLPVLSLHFDNDGFLEKSRAGFFCHSDPDELNRRFRTLVSRSAEYLNRSRAAQRFIRQNYDIRKNVACLLDSFN